MHKLLLAIPFLPLEKVHPQCKNQSPRWEKYGFLFLSNFQQLGGPQMVVHHIPEMCRIRKPLKITGLTYELGTE